MKIKYILLTSTICLFVASGAQAADAVIEQEPAPVVIAPTFTWNGAYIGGQVGYGWGASRFTSRGGGEKVESDGFLGGLYAGYNFGLGNKAILGIDGDITYNDLRGDIARSFEDADIATSVDSRLRWSGAVRARIGYAVDRVLPYIAGGVAFGNVKNAFLATSGTISANNFGSTESKTLTGWTVGAGADYAVTDNIILRLEYRYTDYGHKDFSSGFEGVSFRNKFKTNEVRLGVAYKF